MEGGCLCGAVRYQVSALGPVVHCHCAYCRRAHAAAFTTVSLLPRSHFEWLDGARHVTLFETPRGAERVFCSSCGTRICNHPPIPGALSLMVATLDCNDALVPLAHVNVERRATWYAGRDELPEYSGVPSLGELRRLASS